METLNMSKGERGRLAAMAGVQRQELTLVQASGLLGLGHRQTKRVWRRYQTQGNAGLVHRLRGQPSARRKPGKIWAQVLALYAGERYADFGPCWPSIWNGGGWPMGSRHDPAGKSPMPTPLSLRPREK
jgi:hypothetical protein